MRMDGDASHTRTEDRSLIVINGAEHQKAQKAQKDLGVIIICGKKNPKKNDRMTQRKLRHRPQCSASTVRNYCQTVCVASTNLMVNLYYVTYVYEHLLLGFLTSSEKRKKEKMLK